MDESVLSSGIVGCWSRFKFKWTWALSIALSFISLSLFSVYYQILSRRRSKKAHEGIDWSLDPAIFGILNFVHAWVTFIASSWILFGTNHLFYDDVFYATSPMLEHLICFTLGYLLIDLSQLFVLKNPEAKEHWDYYVFHLLIFIAFSLCLVNGSGQYAALWGFWGEIFGILEHHKDTVTLSFARKKFHFLVHFATGLVSRVFVSWFLLFRSVVHPGFPWILLQDPIIGLQMGMLVVMSTFNHWWVYENYKLVVRRYCGVKQKTA